MKVQYDLEELRALREGPGLVHPMFGDLNRPDAVVMGQNRNGARFEERSSLFIHLSVTGRCQARCKGCINAAVTSGHEGDRCAIVPIRDTDPERDARCILHLLEDREESSATVCFYGGEPLLALEKLYRVWQILEAESPLPIRPFLYTGGDLLDRALARHEDFVRSVWLYAISIDGTREQHQQVRRGTNLDRIHANLEKLRRVRSGEVLMWSTLREEQSLGDCFEEFLGLYGRGLAGQFFWHWVETEEPFDDFPTYASRYEEDLCRVMETYEEHLGQGRVLPLVHVNELLLFLLTGRQRNGSGCGVELRNNYDLIDGKIHSCADLPPELAIGVIEASGKPELYDTDLSALLAYKAHLGCAECGVHAYCGGRCPVQAYASSAERLVQYCQLMRLHVGVVQRRAPAVSKRLELQGLSLQDLYDRSAYYAQFTDVTP